jgi:hypothetical protein
MNITATLGGLNLQNFTVPFQEEPLDNATDVTTLDFTIYTDFVKRKRRWTLNWYVLNESDYNDLYDVYTNQFDTSTYPTFVCAYYSINTPVRMYLNTKDIRKDGCLIYGVQVTLVEETGV